MFNRSQGRIVFFICASLAAFASGCNGSESDAGKILGQDGVALNPDGSNTANTSTDESPGNPAPNDVTPTPTATTTPGPTPTVTATPTPTPTTVGSSCSSSDTSQYCLALKYVAYADSNGKPVVSQTEAIQNIANMNAVWKTCKIAFQMDEFLTPNPTTLGLTFNTANYNELEDIRQEFQDKKTLLVVTTGSWNRSGSLGSTGANAWTNMPGNTNLGAILESDVGTYSNIIAHELGHYLNLDHDGSTSNLMSPIIYETSTQLTTAQCNAARAAVQNYWPAMKR